MAPTDVTTTDLTGTTALITGSTSGIGRATAVALAGRGAHVLITGRDEIRGNVVVDAIRSGGGKADLVIADLADERAVRTLAEQAAEMGGGHVDLLVNNAGVFPIRSTVETTAAEIDWVYSVNVKAPFLLVAALAPGMMAHGKGVIVNVASTSSRFGKVGRALYGSSKAAMVLLTKAWAAEFGPHGIRVAAVTPGATRTEGNVPLRDGMDKLVALAPARRVAEPEELAAAICYLASDGASYIHGAILDVDGGLIAAGVGKAN
jgi:NAD(P)-dependent dehydrogenase (short-subunit alcohol dehydrogenase family)